MVFYSFFDKETNKICIFMCVTIQSLVNKMRFNTSVLDVSKAVNLFVITLFHLIISKNVTYYFSG